MRISDWSSDVCSSDLHIALETGDIYGTVERLRRNGLKFLDTPDTYYELLDARVPGHGEDLARLKENRILLDGASDGGLLLQIFTENQIGRSEEHTSELQSLIRISYAVLCLKKQNKN